MAVVQLQVAGEVRDRLGPALTEVAQRLWARDCQSCVRPLAGHVPALVVDELGPLARASLHHPGCRASQWNDTGMVTFTAGAALSFSAGAMLLAADQTEQLTRTRPRWFRARRRLPALLVNPALEEVQLRLDGERWHCDAAPGAASLGLRPLAQPVDPTRPLDMAGARIQAGAVIVHFGDAVWSAILLPPITEAITAESGLVLMLTSAVNPGEPALTDHAVRQLLARPRDVALGWVPLLAAAAEANPRNQRLSPSHS